MAAKIFIEIVLVMTCILAGGYHNTNIRMFVCKRYLASIILSHSNNVCRLCLILLKLVVTSLSLSFILFPSIEVTMTC